VVEPLQYRRRQHGVFRLADGIVHTGGVVAATRQQGHDRNWRSPACPEEKFSEQVGPITVDTGKGLNGSRMAEWPVVAMKESNVSGAKGPC
jgi:hypothetical protein